MATLRCCKVTLLILSVLQTCRSCTTTTGVAGNGKSDQSSDGKGGGVGKSWFSSPFYQNSLYCNYSVTGDDGALDCSLGSRHSFVVLTCLSVISSLTVLAYSTVLSSCSVSTLSLTRDICSIGSPPPPLHNPLERQ